MKIKNKKVYLRASSLSLAMTGTIGLSETQLIKLQEYHDRRDGTFLCKKGKPLSLSDNMEKEMIELERIKDNPELPQTAKSYLDEIAVSYVYDVQKEVDSSSMRHGRDNEVLSIHQLNAFFKSIMASEYDFILDDDFKKNEERKYRDDIMLTGEADIVRDSKYIIDVKNPVSPFTLDKAKSELIDVYEWQGQAYCELYDVPVCYFIYTLNETEYMTGDYNHLTQLDKLTIHKVVRSEDRLNEYKERLPLIEKYLESKIKEIRIYNERTRAFAREIASLEVGTYAKT